jgi:hypothetical protein
VRTTSGPDPAGWLAGLFRGFHPLRWLACLVGLVLTGLSAVVAMSFFGRGPPDVAGWWRQPSEQAQALGAEILGGSLGRLVLRGAPLLALNTALWCLIGGWIARLELVARGRGRYDTTEWRAEPSATAFLAGWWKSLLTCCPSVLVVMLLLLLPVALAGWLSAGLGSLGALVVSLLLPVLLVADLALLLVILGAVAWPLMPVTVAAECGDQFDAISRSYSYLFLRPARSLLLTATALGLAGLPLAALYPFAEPMTAWPPEARQAVFLLAAALCASIFWSLETLVYLHLRWAVDDVDAGETAGVPPRESPGTPSPEGQAAEPPASGDSRPAGGRSLLRGTILWLAGAVGSWCLTFWLLGRASGGRAGWLGWGLGESLLPPAEGVYRVASVIAGLWGAFWLALPLVQAVRQLLSGGAARDEGLRRRLEAKPGRVWRRT